MTYPEPNWLFPVVAAIQILGLFSAWLARASQKSQRHQTTCQALLLLALAAVAFTAIAATQFPSAVWLMSGVTLPVMIVGTTCDFRRVGYVQHTHS
jgi:hypothetical protein